MRKSSKDWSGCKMVSSSLINASDQPQGTTPSLRSEVKYNVVCAYALVAAQVEEMREAYAAKAISLLNELKDAGFFSIKARLDHLGVDTDLDPLRERDDFKAFLEATKKAARGTR